MDPCSPLKNISSSITSDTGFFYLLQLQQKAKKQTEETIIQEEFCSTDSEINPTCIHENFELLYIITRFSVHGFHHKIWKTKHLHVTAESCICILRD